MASQPPLEPREPSAAARGLALLLCLLALGLVGRLLGVGFAAHVVYPFDLEWMEGGMLVHAQRVMEGLPIYVRPGPDFIPYLYPPLYHWTLAGLGEIFGLGYAPGRALSFAGTLAAAAALVAAVRAERGPLAFGLGAAALYLSCYEDSGGFYDLVRTDGMAMGLLAWALVLARQERLAAGGLLLALAFATKHNNAAFGLPIALWLWKVKGWRSAARFAGWSAGPALAFTLAMQWSTDGLFLRWLLGVPAVHPIVGQRLFPGTPRELFEALPISTALMLVVTLASARRASAAGLYWLAQGLTALLLTAVMRGHHGGFINVLMPAHWALSLGAALAAVALLRRWRRGWLLVGLAAVFLVQTWKGLWEPGRYLPKEEDLRAGQVVLKRIAAAEGEVFSPYAPWYPALVGKKPSFALISLWDIDHPGGPFVEDVALVKAALARGDWELVFVANDDRLGYGLKDGYSRAERLPLPGRGLFPKTGWARRPAIVYQRKRALPKDAPEAPEARDAPMDQGEGPEDLP